MKTKVLLLLAGIVVCTSVPRAWGVPSPDPLALGRQYSSWFYAGETDRIWQLFSPEMRQLVGSAQGLKQFRAQVVEKCGHEIKVLDEHAQTLESGLYYERQVLCSAATTPMLVRWAVGRDGRVTGFSVDLISQAVHPVRLLVGPRGRKEISNDPLAAANNGR